MGTYKQRIEALKNFKTSLPTNIDNRLSGQSPDVPSWEGGTSKEKFTEFVEESSDKVEHMLDTISSFRGEVQKRIDFVQREFDSEVSKEKSRVSSIHGKDKKETKKKRKSALSAISDSSVKERVRNALNLY